jgi:hypothetical protein
MFRYVNSDRDKRFFSAKLAERFRGPPCLLFKGLYFLGQSGRDVRLTTGLYIDPGQIMSGVIPLLPLYVFMAWKGTDLLL